MLLTVLATSDLNFTPLIGHLHLNHVPWITHVGKVIKNNKNSIFGSRHKHEC